MTYRYLKKMALSMVLAFVVTQNGYSRVENVQIPLQKANTLASHQPTLIEKALVQRKKGKKIEENVDADQLKSLSTIHKPVVQSFLATQNQMFSRFIQAIFLTNI